MVPRVPPPFQGGGPPRPRRLPDRSVAENRLTTQGWRAPGDPLHPVPEHAGRSGDRHGPGLVGPGEPARRSGHRRSSQTKRMRPVQSGAKWRVGSATTSGAGRPERRRRRSRRARFPLSRRRRRWSPWRRSARRQRADSAPAWHRRRRGGRRACAGSGRSRRGCGATCAGDESREKHRLLPPHVVREERPDRRRRGGGG
jgi:hypothetical protein